MCLEQSAKIMLLQGNMPFPQAVDALRGRWDTRPSFMVHTALLLLFPEEAVLADVAARRPMSDIYADYAMSDEFPAEFLAQDAEKEVQQQEEALRRAARNVRKNKKAPAINASQRDLPPASPNDAPAVEKPVQETAPVQEPVMPQPPESASAAALLEGSMSLPPGFMTDDTPWEAPGQGGSVQQEFFMSEDARWEAPVHIAAAWGGPGSMAGSMAGSVPDQGLWEAPAQMPTTQRPGSMAGSVATAPWEAPLPTATQPPVVHATHVSPLALQALLSGGGLNQVHWVKCVVQRYSVRSCASDVCTSIC